MRTSEQNDAKSAHVALDPQKVEIERLKLVVDVWKKTVEVQQHFNDLELRIRNFALTLLVGVLGGTAFAIQQGFFVTAGSYRLSLASLLLLAGAVAWLGFYVLDRHWYHRLLVGSVEHGQNIEKAYRERLPEITLAHAISTASHVEMNTWPKRLGYLAIGTVVVFVASIGPLWLLRRDLVNLWTTIAFAVWALGIIVISRAVLMRDWKIRARHRIDFFYGSIAIMLLILAWVANTAIKTFDSSRTVSP